MKNKKATVTLRTILTTLIVFVTLGIGLFYTTIEVSNNYNVTRSAEFNDTLTNFEDNFDQITKETRQVRNRSLGTAGSQETTSGFDFKSAISSLKLVWNFFTAIQNLMNQLAAALGIPAIFVTGVIMILIVTITLIFLKAVFGVEL